MNRIIDAWPLRHGEECRVAFEGYRGKTYLHLRRWWRPSDGGDWQPGKGLALPPEDLPRLRRAIEAAEAAAIEAGLLEPEDYENAGLPVPPALRGAA